MLGLPGPGCVSVSMTLLEWRPRRCLQTAAAAAAVLVVGYPKASLRVAKRSWREGGGVQASYGFLTFKERAATG